MRKMADCRRFESDNKCTLTIIGEEDEVIATAAQHAATMHGHTDGPELREQIRVTLGSVVVASGSTSGSLEGKIAASQAKEGEVRAGIGRDSHQIAGFEGSIADLQTRLSALESSLAVERSLLASIRSQLSVARTRL